MGPTEFSRSRSATSPLVRAISSGLGHAERWIGADFWEGAADAELTLDRIVETSEVCVIGVDGGGLDELLGIGVLGRHAETKVWQHWACAWVDRDALKLYQSIAPELQELVEQGELTLVDNLESEAFPEVANYCARIRDAGLLPEQYGIGMGSDGTGALIDALLEADFELEDLCTFGHAHGLISAIKGAAAKLKSGQLKHCGQQLMRWCVCTSKVEPSYNEFVVTRRKSGSLRVDPLMALAGAVLLMGRNPVAAGA